MTGAPYAWARFDDLCTGTAVRCPARDRILVAERIDEVDRAEGMAVVSSLQGSRAAECISRVERSPVPASPVG